MMNKIPLSDVDPKVGDIYYTDEPGLYYVYSDKGVWDEVELTMKVRTNQPTIESND